MSSTMMIRSDGVIVKITRQSPTRSRHCADVPSRRRTSPSGSRWMATPRRPRPGVDRRFELLGGIGMDDDPPWRVRQRLGPSSARSSSSGMPSPRRMSSRAASASAASSGVYTVVAAVSGVTATFLSCRDLLSPAEHAGELAAAVLSGLT
jgi:hypothetical protein